MTILDKIIASKQREVAESQAARPLDEIKSASADFPKPRQFLAPLAVKPRHGIHLIAEVKKASPSAGVIVEDYDPASIAATYQAHGASAVSVLTDAPFFGGALSHIECVKAAIDLPVLRKDFIIDKFQVYESLDAGADAILLIAEVLGPLELAQFHAIARQLDLGVIVEVHTEKNLHAVVDKLGPPTECSYALGINNRDLARQQTDISTTKRLAALLPPGSLCITESGIASREDVDAMQELGISAMLAGESILRADDRGAAIDRLLGLPRAN